MFLFFEGFQPQNVLIFLTFLIQLVLHSVYHWLIYFLQWQSSFMCSVFHIVLPKSVMLLWQFKPIFLFHTFQTLFLLFILNFLASNCSKSRCFYKICSHKKSVMKKADINSSMDWILVIFGKFSNLWINQNLRENFLDNKELIWQNSVQLDI